MFNFLKKKVYCGGEMLKKRSRELRKFIKTMFYAPGTEVTSLEPAHSLGNTQNGVLKSFVCCCIFCLCLCFETEFPDICRKLEEYALFPREIVFIKQRYHL